MKLGFILSLLMAAVLVLFGLQNAEPTTLNFFSATVDVSLAIVIFIATIVGAVIMYLLGLKKDFKLSHGNKRLTRQSDHYQSELEAQKNVGVSDKADNDLLQARVVELEAKLEACTNEIHALSLMNKKLSASSPGEA
jgi:uncharacterized integral membrane protein